MTPMVIQVAFSPKFSTISDANMVKSIPPTAPKTKIIPMARPLFLMNHLEATVLEPMGAEVWKTTLAAEKAM